MSFNSYFEAGNVRGVRVVREAGLRPEVSRRDAAALQQIQDETNPSSKVLPAIVEKLSYSVDSVRAYGWEVQFSLDLTGGNDTIRRPLTLAAKSFSGLNFSKNASPIGILGIGQTGKFTLTTPEEGTFTIEFDDLLQVNVGVILFNAFKEDKQFNVNLYKLDGNRYGNRSLKTHYFMKDVVITSIKQSDLNYSKSNEFSTYQVEFKVGPTNFFMNDRYIDPAKLQTTSIQPPSPYNPIAN